MNLVVRKFSIIEKAGLRMRRLKPDDIPVAWNAAKDQVIINVDFPHHDAWWFFPNLVRALSHEWLHKIIYRIAGFHACYRFEKVDDICGLSWGRNVYKER